MMKRFLLTAISLTLSSLGQHSGESSGFENMPDTPAYYEYGVPFQSRDYDTDGTSGAFEYNSEYTQEPENTEAELPWPVHTLFCACSLPPEETVELKYELKTCPVEGPCRKSNPKLSNVTRDVNYTETFSELGNITNTSDVGEITRRRGTDVELSIGSVSNASQQNIITVRSVRLCGYPPYNDRSACRKQNYSSDPLSNCEIGWKKVLFSIIIGSSATAVICANCLIIAAITRSHEMRTPIDYIKVSLAIADAIIGFLVLSTVLPNMVWIGNLSEEETLKFTRRDTNSPTAIVVGSILNVTLQTSLLHLCFLSIERFTTIQWTFWQLRRKTKSVLLTLVGIWMISVVGAFLPAMLPAHFEYRFQPVLLIHMMNMKAKSGTANGLGYAGIVYTSVTFLLPFTVTVLMCILTAVTTYRKLRASSRRLFGNESSISTGEANSQTATSISDSKKSIAMRKRLALEFSVYLTVIIMIAAFTVTLVPFFSVVAMFISGKLNCSNYTIPYAASFYFHVLNSLANFIIYTLRNPKFRSSVKRQFCKRDMLKST